MRSHTAEKTGRNDRCPCGSGKKYKRCCLPIHTAPDVSPWKMQRDASDRLTGELLKLATREFGDDLLLAWADFNQVLIPDPIDKYPNEEAIFSPYMIFEWDPDMLARRRGTRPRAGVVLRAYMAKAASRLSELELQLLEQAITRPVSFYEIVRCDPGRSAVLRDILIGEEMEVEEHTATQTMRPGDLVYGQVWILPEVVTLGMLAPCVITPDRKVEIVRLRAKLQRRVARQNRSLDADDLVRYTEEIRTVYLNIRDIMRMPPRLSNTDGDPIELHTLTYKIGSAQVAFDALAPLAWGMSKEDLLDEAEMNADGTLLSVHIPWSKKGNRKFKTWENTILGHLNISGRSLKVEVNSVRRAEKIREEIEKRLGFHAVHQSTRSLSPEEMLKESKRKKPGHAAPGEIEGNEPTLDPEMRSYFEEQMRKQMETWVYQRIPALGGRTPMQAVSDPDGKEMVEALLLGWERQHEKPRGPGMIRPDINAVRKLLNLPVSIEAAIE